MGKETINVEEFIIKEVTKKEVVLENNAGKITEPKYKMPLGVGEGDKVYKTSGGFYETQESLRNVIRL